MVNMQDIWRVEFWKPCYILIMLLGWSGCYSSSMGISESIAQYFQSSGRTLVNLDEIVTIPWDRVCILGPYSDNAAATVTLGFPWDAEHQTTIVTSDSIALLLFVKDMNVVEFVEHPRIDGDFANLSRQCILREKAVFTHQTNPKKGWPGLFPKDVSSGR